MESIHENNDIRVPINANSLSIIRDEAKCVLCGACRSTCKFSQGVYGEYDLEKTNDQAICIDCGQCANICPSNAICEKQDYIQLKELMKDKTKTFVFQTAPATRIALGEEFSMEAGENVTKKLVAVLRKLGATFVFDTTFGADLTILEEAYELVNHLKAGKKQPMFTSCCPAWVTFAELFYPQYLANLSTAKSPILMQGAIIKTYFSQKENIPAKDIINVAITPCTAKKAEIKRPEMNSSGIFANDEQINDVDYVITVRELAKWIREEKIDFSSIEDSKYDELFNEGSGAGFIFGNTGGVMEAALRTANYFLTGKINDALFEYTPVRGLEEIKETTVEIEDKTIKIAVIHGTNNVRKFLKMMEEENLHYDFVEVMACLGGCIGGGGQPKMDPSITEEKKQKRMQGLYEIDSTKSIRNSFENPKIQALYHEFLGRPGSDKALQLLHTTYTSKEQLLNVKEEQPVS